MKTGDEERKTEEEGVSSPLHMIHVEDLQSYGPF